MRPRTLAAASLALALLVPALVRGAVPAETALREVERRAREAVASQAPREALSKIADDAVDFEELTRRAMRKAWTSASAKERARMVELVRGVVEAAYLPRVRSARDYTFEIKGAEQKGLDATVRAVASAQGRTVPLDFRMHTRGGKWLVYDAVVDRTSVVESSADQFEKVIARDGVKGLLAALEKRRAALEKAAERAPEGAGGPAPGAGGASGDGAPPQGGDAPAKAAP
jgi:ABC-type transporter MlaC component